MGILDSLASELLNGASEKKAGAKAADSGQGSQLAQAVFEIVLKIGVPKLIGMFQKEGLGEQVMSWIQPGKNLPISASQVQKALGSSIIGELARKTGMKEPSVASGLASCLPSVIDALTPDGNTDDDSVKKASSGLDLGSIGGLLGSFLK